ncbi:MAG: hypothetical protein ACXVPY_01190 [Bacteroidia bacterium]
MKKLILSSAVILLVGLTTFAQDNVSAAKKGSEKKCEMKACCKGEKCDKACMDKCTASGTSCKDNKSCTKATASAETKTTSAKGK